MNQNEGYKSKENVYIRRPAGRKYNSGGYHALFFCLCFSYMLAKVVKARFSYTTYFKFSFQKGHHPG